MALGGAEHRLEVVGGDPREGPLRRLGAMLRDVSDESERRGLVATSLAKALPQETRWSAAAARLAMQRGAASALTPAGIAELAGSAREKVKAVLLAVAADCYARAGDRVAARRASELACQTDPSLPRAVATLADIVQGERDRAAAAALERALHVIGARAAWCRSLAAALEELGEDGYAVAWTQRLVALRPGDLEAVHLLLERILHARDAQRLGDALAWVLSQPQPFAELAALFARALAELCDLDPDRAVILARRALDVFGPKHALLRDVMIRRPTARPTTPSPRRFWSAGLRARPRASLDGPSSSSGSPSGVTRWGTATPKRASWPEPSARRAAFLSSTPASHASSARG